MLTDETTAEIIRMKSLPVMPRTKKPPVKARPRKRPVVHAAGSRKSIALVNAWIAQEQRRRTRAAAERELSAVMEERQLRVNKRRRAWS